MGASASKHEKNNGAFSRSVSMPLGSNTIFEHKNENIKPPWKSRLFSMPKPSRIQESLMNAVDFSTKLESVQEELDLSPTHKSNGNGSFRRSISFQPTRSESGRYSLSSKSFKENQTEMDKSGAFDMCWSEQGIIKSPSTEEMINERNLGLRYLLKPEMVTTQSFTSRSRSFSSKRSFNLRTAPADLGDLPCNVSGFTVSPKFHGHESRSDCDWISPREASIQSGSVPLFDPSILAKFERAVNSLSYDHSEGSDSHSNSSAFTGSCSESTSDADSPKLEILENSSFEFLNSDDVNSVFQNSSCLGTDAFLSRRFPLSRVFSLKRKDKDWTGLDYLGMFEMRSPPDCKDKVVLYFTSLRGVRKTFEECYSLKLILKGFGVHVDERDVWMHSQYRQELTEILGAPLSVPRLFILGRYIGGAEEVQQLNEEGILAKMLEDIPTDWRQTCEVCADVRFVPCITCSGSCKTISFDGRIERCSECNENGLIMCPLCNS